jgi:small multidrug resistance pump
MQQWFFLLAAIVSEVIATSALKASDGFSRFWPSVIVAAGYVMSSYFLSITLKTLPVGVAYAVWSGIGVSLITLVAWIKFRQSLDSPALLGLSMIVAGVIVLNIFSKSVAQ